MRAKELKKKAVERVDITYLRQYGIQGFGEDNLYPQTLRNIIAGSSTASECVGTYANFIEGNGFSEIAFSEYVVNRDGDTADDIHSLICQDVAVFDGLAVHVNYNIFGEIIELQYIPFDNCRLLEEDDYGYVAKIAVHPDWTGKKTRTGKPLKVDKEHIDYIDIFNPMKEVVLSQMKAAGGVESYKGQILWVSGAGRNIYPRSRADRVVTGMATDQGLANVKYRNACCNFLLAGAFITKKGTSVDTDGEDSNDDKEDTSFSRVIERLQGDVNAGRMLEVEIAADEEKPEFISLRPNNYDKEFTVTDASTVERIYSAYGQEPWHCIRIGKVGFSGDILEDAFEYYNSIVSKQQRMIERTFQKVFKYWHTMANPSNDYSVQPLKYVRNATIPNNPQ